MRVMIFRVTGKYTRFWGGRLNDLHTRMHAGKETVDGGLLGSIHIASMNDVAVHQDAIDTDDIYNMFPF